MTRTRRFRPYQCPCRNCASARDNAGQRRLTVFLSLLLAVLVWLLWREITK